jgi:WD40 repeat protein
VTGGDQGYLSRWDLDTGEELPRLQTQYGLLFGIEFSPDGRLVASACGDGTVQIWDFAAEKPLVLMQGHAYGAWSVAWTADGKQLAAGAGDGTVKVWDPETGSLLRETAAVSTKIDSLRFSAGDSQLGAVSIGERALILDFQSLQEVYGFPEFVSGMRSADFSPDGEWAALAAENGLAYVWNTQRGKVYALGETRPSSNAEVSAVFSPDGGTLAVADGLAGRLRLFAVPSLALRSEILIPGLRAVAFSEDGHFVAAGGSSELVLMETDSGNVRKTASPSRLTSLAFPNPPGGGDTYLAGGFEDGSVLLWDLQDLETSRVLSEGGGNPVWSLTAGGPLLAAGDDRGIIRIWDVPGGRIIKTIYAFSSAVFSLAISPDGSLLAAGGMQGSVRFWSIPGGKLLRTISAHNGWVYGLDFSNDGRWVLSAGADGAGRIWGVSP